MGILAFFMPVVYFLRLKWEQGQHLKQRKEIIEEFQNDGGYNCINDNVNKQINNINQTRKKFEYVNVLTKRLFWKDFFDTDGEPKNDVGFEGAKTVDSSRLNRAYEVFNKSIFSGFWSLILHPLKPVDISFLFFIFDNKEKTKSLIIIEKQDAEQSILFKFVNENEVCYDEV
jgi:hypothetical protein